MLHPGCVVAAQSADDISKTMKVIVANQCKFAVRGGGHNANVGANSIDNGVSIDLSRLNQTSLAADRSFVSLGGGTTWGQAYDAFNSSNIGFPGGICEDVGAGGISLGGGQSVFQPKVGWVIDNIVNYEVVLASGEIVNANQTSRSDLYKALKGGNTNFGVVTKVSIAAFDFDGLWGGEIVVGLDTPGANRSDLITKITQATIDFTANNHLDTDTAILLMTAYLAGKKGQIVTTAFGNTKGVENPPSLKPFAALPNQVKNSAAHVKLADFVHQVSAFQPKGFRQTTASLTISNDFKTMREIWDATDAVYDALPEKDKVDWMVMFVPQPKIQQTFAALRGGNSLGLADVEDDQIGVLHPPLPLPMTMPGVDTNTSAVVWLTSRWTDPTLDAMMEGARKDFVDVSEAIAKKHDAFSPWLYINYAASFQDPLCGYGAESVKFLKETARKYDPEEVFQKLMPGGFKVSQATCA